VASGARTPACLVVPALGFAGRRAWTAGPATEAETPRLGTEGDHLRVSAARSPPLARALVRYSVVGRDRKTRAAIDTGEGRIVAANEDRKNTDNGCEKAPEPGTYRTKLFFAVAGNWAMGIQFRRDSTQRLQRTNDWYQEVLGATEPSQD